jgi:hypothetical protein
MTSCGGSPPSSVFDRSDFKSAISKTIAYNWNDVMVRARWRFIPYTCSLFVVKVATLIVVITSIKRNYKT